MTKKEMLKALSDARIIQKIPLPWMRVIVQDKEFIIVNVSWEDFSIVHQGEEVFMHKHNIQEVLGYPMTVGDLINIYVNKYHFQYSKAMEEVHAKYGTEYEYLDSKDIQKIRYFYELLCC